MLIRRISPVCIRSQRIIYRHQLFLPPQIYPTSYRFLTTSTPTPSSENSDKNAPKSDGKSDLASRLLPPQRKKIDFKKKAKEIAALAWDASKKGAVVIFDHLRHPSKIPISARYVWQAAKDEAHHYWVGSKLLWAEVKTASGILQNSLQGKQMTRRERLQLIRTTLDLVRLVPFSLFIIIPFMEFLLPLAIKIFPNMLPSTFEDSLKKEESLKKELAMRLSVASFFIDTFQAMAEKRKKKSGDSNDQASATELIEFMEKAKMGEPLPKEAVLRMSRLFKDELTLDNVSRSQLTTMCQFMGLPHFGTDTFLRFQLRTKITSIKEDDKRILWEGVESLSSQELRDACQERGMRATGLNTFGYRKQMKEWLDLSMQKQIPISLLIMSRAFVLKTTVENTALYTAEETLKTSLSAMEDDLVNEVIVQSARSEEAESVEMKQRRLESIIHQNEKIREEAEERTEALKREEEERRRREMEDIVVPAVDSSLIAEESVGSRQVEGTLNPGDVMPPVVEFDMTKTPSLAEVVRMEKMEGVSAPAMEAEVVATAPAPQSHRATPVAPKEVEVKTPPTSPSSTPLPKSDGAETPLATTKEKEKDKDKDKDRPPLTVAELQALSDLTQVSAVEREKLQLAMLKEMVGSLEDDYEFSEHDLQQATRVYENIEYPQSAAEEPAKGSATSVTDTSTTRTTSTGTETPQAAAMTTPDEKTSPKVSPGHPPSALDREDAEDESHYRSMKSALMGMMTKLEKHIQKTESALGDKLQRLDRDRDGVVNSEELAEVVMNVLKNHPSSDEAVELIKVLDKDNDGKVSVQELREYVATRRLKMEEEDIKTQKPKDTPSIAK